MELIEDSIDLHKPVFYNLPEIQNLNIHVKKKSGRLWPDLRKYVKTSNGEVGNKTVIYCLTRLRAEMIAKVLNDNGIKSSYFHKGLAKCKKMKAIKEFNDGNVQVGGKFTRIL